MEQSLSGAANGLS